MKTVPLPLRVLTVGLCIGALSAQGPVLQTPGTATWRTTDNRTVFRITDDTVINWDHLHVRPNEELVFRFEGGSSVINNLGGDFRTMHLIEGSVRGVGNGLIGFFSPQASLSVTGDIAASGVVLATLGVDQADFQGGGDYRLSSNSGLNTLTVNGRVEATNGDVVVAGNFVTIGVDAELEASGVVSIAGGSEVDVSRADWKRVWVNSGTGFVLHLGDTRSSRIQVSAGSEIKNQGSLGGGGLRCFWKSVKGAGFGMREPD